MDEQTDLGVPTGYHFRKTLGSRLIKFVQTPKYKLSTVKLHCQQGLVPSNLRDSLLILPSNKADIGNESLEAVVGPPYPTDSYLIATPPNRNDVLLATGHHHCLLLGLCSGFPPSLTPKTDECFHQDY